MPVIFLCIPATFGEVVPAVTLGGLACRALCSECSESAMAELAGMAANRLFFMGLSTESLPSVVGDGPAGRDRALGRNPGDRRPDPRHLHDHVQPRRRCREALAYR